MSDKIRVNYPALEEMAQHFEKLAQETEDIVRNMGKMGQQLADSAMIGDTGDAISTAIAGPFSASSMRLVSKFREVAQDIKSAIADMRAADRDAGAGF